MKGLRFIILASLVAVSCSVRENRGDCPSFLSLTVTPQVNLIFEGGRAWCDLFAEDGTRLEHSPLTDMGRRDTTLLYRINPRRTVSAVVSNKEITGGVVVAGYGEEFCELWAYRKDIPCTGDEVSEIIQERSKQFCRLTVRLSEESLRFAPGLSVRVDAPYDGICFPSMKVHPGKFSFSAAFDEEGRATVCLPRQDGGGLTLNLVKPDDFTLTFDLYEAMRAAGYDWSAPSLDNFDMTVTLSSLSGDIEIADWSAIGIGDREF